MRERIRERVRIRARGLGDVHEIGEIVGEAVSEVASAIGEAIAEAVSAATGIWRGGTVKVEMEESVGEPVVLVVNADASNVRVHDGPPGRVRVTGYKGHRGEVRLHIEERGGKKIARLVAEAANVRVEAPLRAVGVVADSSSVRVEARSRPLDYLSVKADSSGVRAEVALAGGGGVYAKLDSSAVKVYATPTEDGEYWIDVDADSSGFRAEFAGDKTYEIEEETLHSTRLVVERTTSGEAKVKVKVRIKADASAIRLL